MQFAPPRRNGGLIINVTSLIDVMFLLLIFFLVTSTFKHSPAIDLVLPNSTSAKAVSDGPATLYLAGDGSIYLDADRLDEANVIPELRRKLAATGDDRIVLRADSRSEHGDVVKLIDWIKQSGYTRVSLAARTASND
jgi:biopolymer transport protein ExbD